jgi:hypothetical protein
VKPAACLQGAEPVVSSAREIGSSASRAFLQFCGGIRLLDDLPKEHVANDAELEELLTKASRGETDKKGYSGSR